MVKITLYTKSGSEGKYRKKTGCDQICGTKEQSLDMIKECFKALYEKSMQTIGMVDYEEIYNENESILIIKPMIIFYKNTYYRFTLKEF